MPEKTILFGGMPMKQLRSDSANGDVSPYRFVQYSANMFYDAHSNPFTKEGDVHLVARPGFVRNITQVAASNNAQGIYWWSTDHGSGFGKVYAVINGVLYSASAATHPFNTISSVGTLTGCSTTKGCWFDEFDDGTNKLLLVKCEDGNLYTVTTAGTITRITDTDYTGLTAVGQIAVMNQFIFAVKADGTIANCDYRTPGTWTSTSTIQAASLQDAAKALVRVGDFILCLGEYSTEWFRNAQNPVGSPLAYVKTDRIGCVSHKTIARWGDDVYFIGKNAEGVVAAYRIRGGQIEPISTPDIDRYIGGGDDTCKAAILYMEGHPFYIINPGTYGGTFFAASVVFDIRTSSWHFWDTYYTDQLTGKAFFYYTEGNQFAAVFPQVSGTTGSTIVYTLAPLNVFGETTSNNTACMYYREGIPTYTDHNGAISYGITIDEQDFGTEHRKTLNALYVVGRSTTGSVSVTLAITQPNSGAFYDMNFQNVPCKLHRLGTFRRAKFGISWSNAWGAVKGFRFDYTVSTT